MLFSFFVLDVSSRTRSIRQDFVSKFVFQAMLIDPEEIDVEDFGRITEINDILLILCMATYGEGDPTDNAQELHQHLIDADINLKGVNYAVS